MDLNGLPATQEPKTHNHLIGDQAALDEAWERDGYWYFRDVLDKGAVDRLRAKFVEELEKLGVIDSVGDAPTERSVRYNGGSLANFPPHVEPLARRNAWRTFVAEKPVHEFFARLLGDEPFWVPVVEYRATPPTQDPDRARVIGIHQDGPYSPGIPFRICWVPAAQIDRDVGGVLFAEGLTAQVNRHPVERDGSNSLIPTSQLPLDCWRHTTYEPGDLLMMNIWTPHSGLTNISDRFRLSFDGRVMAKREKCPVVGTVVSIATDHIEIRDEDGVKSLRIDPETYARDTPGRKVSGDELLDLFKAGSSVIAAFEGDLATVVRPTHA